MGKEKVNVKSAVKARLDQIKSICTEITDADLVTKRELLKHVIGDVVNTMLSAKKDGFVPAYKFFSLLKAKNLGLSDYDFYDFIAVCYNCGLRLGVALDSRDGMDYTEIVIIDKTFKDSENNVQLFPWEAEKKKESKDIKDDEKDKTDAKAENTESAEAGSKEKTDC